MPTVTVRITGLTEIRAKLEKLGAGLKNMSAEFAEVGRELTAYYAGTVFVSQGGVYGERWPSLSPNTLKYKTKHLSGMMAGVSPSQPLVASGKMRDSFKFEAGPASLRVYNDVVSEKNGYPYFKAHQLGLGNNPQRLMIALNDELMEKIKTTIAAGVRARIEAA